jgi:rare lipoprotein A
MQQVLICTLAAVLAHACSTAEPVPPPMPERESRATSGITVLETREGRASYVAEALNGRKTASGVKFDGTAMVAAHPSYPFGTVVRITDVSSGRSVEVEVVDRGPAMVARKDGVIIDLSRAAAERLGFVKDGRAHIRLDVLRWGS